MKSGKFYLLSVACLIFIGLSKIIYAQPIVPDARLTNWDQAGLKNPLPIPDTIILLTDLGAVPNDDLPDDAAFQLALDMAQGQNAEIRVSSGEYLLTESIGLHSGIYLVGAHADSTTLKFNLPVADDLVIAGGSLTGDTLPVAGAYVQDTLLICQADHNVQPGDHFFLNRNADGLVTSDWALHSMGQIITIKGVSGDSLFLDNALRHEYPPGSNPVLIKTNPVENVLISKLHIRRIDSHDQQASNIAFDFVYNAKVHAIISEDCIFSHLSLRHSDHVLVEGSYFHHAHDYGGGGRGYGTEISFATGNSLVVNNVFEHLRHSILLQACANGNVLAYNYSIDPYWDEDFLPSGSAGDLVLHGNYPHRNLFEGNVAQNLVIDDSHGINGHNNAFLRNRLETYGIFMNASPASDSVIFVGNEITDNGMLTGMYNLSGSGHIEFANLQYDTWHPDGTDELNVESWFRETAPCYFQQYDVPWPFCGPPHPLDTYKNPAQIRYEAGQMVFDTCSQVTVNPVEQKKNISIFPNPAAGYLSVVLHEVTDDGTVYITDPCGRIVKTVHIPHGKKEIRISLDECEPGLHVIQIPAGGIREKFMIIR
jgi:hypothetical protein